MKRGDITRARDTVIHERARQHLPVAMAYALEQSLPNALNDAPVCLSFDDHRIDREPHIIDR